MACGRTYSCRSHAELAEATDLDGGHPEKLGAQHADLRRLMRLRPPRCRGHRTSALKLTGACSDSSKDRVLRLA